MKGFEGVEVEVFKPLDQDKVKVQEDEEVEQTIGKKDEMAVLLRCVFDKASNQKDQENCFHSVLIKGDPGSGKTHLAKVWPWLVWVGLFLVCLYVEIEC